MSDKPITAIGAAKHLAEVLGLNINRVHKITVVMEVGKAVTVDVEYFATAQDMAFIEHEIASLKREE
jgi:hypothetical protein